MRVLLADDEPLALDLLTKILADAPDVRVAERCATGEAALASLARGAADLAILDIDMPGMGGMAAARAVRPPTLIVFATAHAEFAAEAFEVEAVDYVLKPFEPGRVLGAIAKAHARLEGQSASPLPVPVTVPVRDGAATRLVRVADVVWAEAAGDYALLHLRGEIRTVRATLAELERTMGAAGLVRVHRSALVNAAKVEAVTPLPKGEATLTMEGGGMVKASRTYRPAIEALLGRT